MAQQLGAFAALKELDSVPKTHIAAHNCQKLWLQKI